MAGSREDLLAAGFLSPGAGAASPDPELDELTRYVAYACNAPYAVLAVEARGKMWFKCRVGVDAAEAPLTELAPGVEVIEDSSRDPRASLHPLLAAVPDARFLAAAPLQDGPARFGTLAVLDRRPRSPAPHQLEALRVAAAQASALLQLRRRVRLLEALIESSPDQFYAFDPRGRCLFASERGASTMGLVPAQMVGRTWQEMGWDSGYAAQFQGMLRLVLDTGQLIEDARAVPTPAGVVHTEYALGPLRGPRGEIEGVAVTARDVTVRVAAEMERQAAEAELQTREELRQTLEAERLARRAAEEAGETAQKAVRQRDDVLAVVSHDLRNVLGVFRITAAVLSKELPEDAGRARERIAALQGQAAGMGRLVDDLVEVARIDAGSLRIVPGGCDARALAQDAAAAVRPVAQQKGIGLVVQVPEDPVPVSCDRGRILQVFANVLGNAVKFTDRGEVRLEVVPGDGGVRFSIRDTGGGVSPEHLPHLFERYWQARQGERSGAGLGLYIARSIVEAHGGRIWADSTPGQGTTISFTLPSG